MDYGSISANLPTQDRACKMQVAEVDMENFESLNIQAIRLTMYSIRFTQSGETFPGSLNNAKMLYRLATVERRKGVEAVRPVAFRRRW